MVQVVDILCSYILFFIKCLKMTYFCFLRTMSITVVRWMEILSGEATLQSIVLPFLFMVSSLRICFLILFHRLLSSEANSKP